VQDEIDNIVASTSDHPAHTGVVVGVLKSNQRSIYGYGTIGGAPPAGDTIFEIGSVTKVFTTALLSILAAEGVIALDDSAADLATELIDYPPQVTLQRLATHTAGLPKMPSNILGSLLRERDNPYAAYPSEKLLRYLSKHPPSRASLEARQVDYSNVGVALLGILLARRLGDSFEAAIVSKVCEPLGMMDTRIKLTPDQERRMAAPHNPRGKRSHNWDMPAFEGAGALRSTADDLLTFLASHLGDVISTITSPLQDGHAIRSRTFAPPTPIQRLAARFSALDLIHDRILDGMALGWSVGQLPTGEKQVHWRHGATGGYRAFIGFVKEKRLGAVVLANSSLRMRDGLLGTTATDRVGIAVLEHLVASS